MASDEYFIPIRVYNCSYHALTVSYGDGRLALPNAEGSVQKTLSLRRRGPCRTLEYQMVRGSMFFTYTYLHLQALIVFSMWKSL